MLAMQILVQFSDTNGAKRDRFTKACLAPLSIGDEVPVINAEEDRISILHTLIVLAREGHFNLPLTQKLIKVQQQIPKPSIIPVISVLEHNSRKWPGL